MCGIAGFTNLDGAPADAGALDAMLRLVAHRGPDDRGDCRVALRGAAPDTALGFHRLSILDRSARGHQPMQAADGQVVLLFNGAIYNAPELRSELQRTHHFTSATDTEVILALYERHGLIGMLDRLNGMFALVIADLRHHVIHLVRDPFGIKPLYWAEAGRAVLFASEAKALLGHPHCRAEVNAGAIDELLGFRFVAGSDTLLKGVRHVRPGHVVTISPEGATERRYWRLPDAASGPGWSRADAVEQLDAALTRSVRAQLQSDVPVGCQLSGGVDSSLVAARAGVDTFSVVLDDPWFSEARWIDEAGQVVQARNHRVPFGAREFVAALDAASWHMDQPISQPNSLALWHLAQHARADVTVLLSGEGADELFAGYRRFLDASAASPRQCVAATQFHTPGRLTRLRPEADLQPAIDKRLAIFAEGEGDAMHNAVEYETQTHLVDVLLRQDRMMMAHGIENRVPFLDRDVVALARAIGGAHLVGTTAAGDRVTTKAIVKDLARRRFGDAFVDRRKWGFNLPLGQYFRSQPFVELMEERLLPGIRERGWVDATVVRRWWRRALSAPHTTEGFWIVVALELWAQQVIDRRARS